MYRWIILAVVSLGILINYLDRVNLAVATPDMLKEFGTSIVQMGYIAAVFNITYMLMQIPVGGLLDKWGIQKVNRITSLGWAITTLGAGFAANLNVFAAWRGALGIAEAALFPANAKVLGYWFPLRERSFATSITISMSKLANIIGIPAIAYVITYFGGWRWAFYSTGIISLIYALIFWAIYKDPWNHSKVTKEELAYIQDGGAQSSGIAAGSYKDNLMYLLKQRKIWGIVLGYWGYSYNFWLLLTWLPTYLVKDMGLSLMKSGWYSALPYIASAAAIILIGGYLPDYLIRKGYNSNVVRKSILIGSQVGGLTIVFAALTTDPYIAILWITVAMGALSPASPMSHTINTIIAPKGMVGTVASLMNVSNNICGIVAPIATGYIVQATGGFAGAFVFDGVVILLSILFYAVILDKIEPIPDRAR